MSTHDVDTVVIGSGAGGLTAAVAFARRGDRVLVLEQHDRPGGWCHSFTLGGHLFSPGVHYVGDLHEGGRLRAVYQGLGLGADLTWFELDPRGFDRVRIDPEGPGEGGFRFEIPRGKEAFADALARAFPHEAGAARRVLDVVAGIDRGLGAAMRARGVVDLALLPVRARTLVRHGFGSFASLLDRCGVRDPRLRAVLGIQGGDHGLPPSKVPAAVHAGVMAHYFEGGYYPRGGGFAIPRALLRALKRAGGDLRVRAPVERILVERRGLLRRRVAVGVRLASGETIRARRVVSNADPGVTFGKLLDPADVSRLTLARLRRARWSVSCVSLFLGVDLDPRAAGLTSGNVWWTTTPDLDQVDRASQLPDLDGLPPALFVTCTTLKDPTKALHQGAHTLEAFAFVPWGLFAPWAGSPSGARPAEYEAFKRRLEAWMLRGLARVVPGVERHVTFSALGTPLTNVHYVASTNGALYGTEKALDQIGPLAWGPATELEGLWLCGASTLSHGVAGASFSGIAVAKAALGCRTKDLLADGQPPLRVLSAEEPAGWPDDVRRDAARRCGVAAVAR
jgi:all-trans-retinol 13,14-reductase